MNYLLCRNGHYYHDALPECPYCPKEKTETGNELERTKVLSNTIGTLEKTQVQSDTSRLSKTQISVSTELSIETEAPKKLAGWLVSFTHNKQGTDYRIFEGENTIGTDIACNIKILNDNLISAKHFSIVCQEGNFKLSSSSETLVNGNSVEEQDLNDNDIIVAGNTVFVFKGIRI